MGKIFFLQIYIYIFEKYIWIYTTNFTEVYADNLLRKCLLLNHSSFLLTLLIYSFCKMCRFNLKLVNNFQFSLFNHSSQELCFLSCFCLTCTSTPTGSILYICIFCCMVVFLCLSISALSLLQDLQAATINPDPSLKEFEGATLRYASLKLRCVKEYK